MALERCDAPIMLVNPLPQITVSDDQILELIDSADDIDELGREPDFGL